MGRRVYEKHENARKAPAFMRYRTIENTTFSNLKKSVSSYSRVRALNGKQFLKFVGGYFFSTRLKRGGGEGHLG